MILKATDRIAVTTEKWKFITSFSLRKGSTSGTKCTSLLALDLVSDWKWVILIFDFPSPADIQLIITCQTLWLTVDFICIRLLSIWHYDVYCSDAAKEPKSLMPSGTLNQMPTLACTVTKLTHRCLCLNKSCFQCYVNFQNEKLSNSESVDTFHRAYPSDIGGRHVRMSLDSGRTTEYLEGLHTKEGPCLESNPSCCEATVLTVLKHIMD